MAILNSIRKRGIFLILIIALALFAFILSDIINKGGRSSELEDTAAIINGEEISRTEFMTKVDDYQRALGPNANTSQAMNVVWDRELKNVLFKQQAEELGIMIGDDQLNDRLALALANNPNFQDENGIFSQGKLVEYIASIQGNAAAKQQWDEYIEGVKESLIQNSYVNLVRSGMVTTKADAAQQYHFENDKANIEYVFVPYTKIADEEVPVTDAEIEKYIRANPDRFEVDPLVDIEYVSFEEAPSLEDMEEAKTNIANLVEDFKAAEDDEFFVNDNSDFNYVDSWYYNRNLPEALKDTILNVSVGEVYGPYKVEETYNISKVVAKRQLPDSVEARHILIPTGFNRTDSISRTKEQAKATADSILSVLKADKSKFENLVKQFSSDAGSIEKGGHYDWYAYGTMVPAFRDFTFEGNVGDLGVVESRFGYHIIEVEGQKNPQTVVKVATVTKEIEPSEATLSEVFSESAKFEEAARKGDFSKVAEDKGLTPKPVNKIGELDGNLPGIGNNRTIINWAFEEGTNVGDVKRFNINDTYVIARLTRKSTKKALMSVSEASSIVTPILRKEKKAQKIKETISGTTLQEVATSQNVTVKTENALTRATPTIAGAGTEPLVVGKAFGTAVGETTDLIEGEKGVYKLRVLAINKAPELDNYAAYETQLKGGASAATVNNTVFKALKKAAEIEDNRAKFY
ncbi:MAG: peptidylprolyl isomerase [Alteromonas sp.]|nr:peptidylprolyl isomerase [Alteromonas sp.]MAY21720.1 peptidylprolyl isomerase [Flavobacteriaceae bacterium]|tara:strand:- start:20515 stop:22584 length:2070 start_codon:yes stop_codon:yes gene_type:complete